MVNKMSLLDFLQDDQGSIAVEYVILVAAAAILLVVGVGALFHAMSDYFNNWAAFFNAGG
jgi:Flp pilus assembly pilin Flp